MDQEKEIGDKVVNWMEPLMFLAGIATGMVGGALLSLEYPIYWLTF